MANAKVLPVLQKIFFILKGRQEAYAVGRTRAQAHPKEGCQASQQESTRGEKFEISGGQT